MNDINLELLAVDGKARVNKVNINKHEFILGLEDELRIIDLKSKKIFS